TQVGHEVAVFRSFGTRVFDTQQIGWGNRDEKAGTVLALDHVAARLRNNHRAFEQAAGGGRAERNDQFGLDDGALPVEPPTAAFDLIDVRLLMKPALPARLEFEVFHRIGDENRGAVETRVYDGAVEHAAGRPDERPAREVFVVAGLLADKHDFRTRRALAGNDLR